MAKKKTLFNFYLDDEDKQKAIEKLTRMSGDRPKGQLAALLRVLIKLFIATPDAKTDPLLIEAVAAEYEYSQTLNKRSNL